MDGKTRILIQIVSSLIAPIIGLHPGFIQEKVGLQENKSFCLFSALKPDSGDGSAICKYKLVLRNQNPIRIGPFWEAALLPNFLCFILDTTY